MKPLAGVLTVLALAERGIDFDLSTTGCHAGKKKGPHLSRPDRRTFPSFIRQAIAEADPGNAHGAGGQCCGCKIAALLGDALASSPGR